MQKPLLRAERLRGLPKELLELFPGQQKLRKVGDMGTYERLDFVRIDDYKPALRLLDPYNLNDVYYGPSLSVLKLPSGAVYSQEEVEIVTLQQVALENVLFDLQTVFPNQQPESVLNSNTSEADRLIVSIRVPESRRLLRNTPRMKYHKSVRKLQHRIRKFAERVAQPLFIFFEVK